ncbi:MAG TPA: hypothetical protein VJO33_14050, partial [Gemmatimonadaceae bacterium]|nr:hypothetical protein [Gemmatimonadaceae bacterium]
PPSVVFTPPAPAAAQIPVKNGTSGPRAADSALPTAGRTAAAAGLTVSADLRRPIDSLKIAIESGLPSKMEEVYRNYYQDEQTKKYFDGIINKADSIHVKSIAFRNSNVIGNTAQLTYRMIINVTSNVSKAPTEVPSTWRADLVRDGLRAPWKIQHLWRHSVP